jgi:hypothetical protein
MGGEVARTIQATSGSFGDDLDGARGAREPPVKTTVAHFFRRVRKYVLRVKRTEEHFFVSN